MEIHSLSRVLCDQPLIRGMADATGVHATRITQVHMIGELTKGSCSMFGAHSSATPDGNLLQLRALDWDTDGPFKEFTGVVEDVNLERSTLRILVTIFGRPTPVELEFVQVQKL